MVRTIKIWLYGADKLLYGLLGGLVFVLHTGLWYKQSGAELISSREKTWVSWQERLCLLGI